jgi:hypothetical protein
MLRLSTAPLYPETDVARGLWADADIASISDPAGCGRPCDRNRGGAVAGIDMLSLQSNHPVAGPYLPDQRRVVATHERRASGE